MSRFGIYIPPRAVVLPGGRKVPVRPSPAHPAPVHVPDLSGPASGTPPPSVTIAPAVVPPGAPSVAGCDSYMGRVRYQTFRKINAGAGGNFACDTDLIRAGYWWKVLQGSGHVENSVTLQLAWFLCPENTRGVIPTQGSTPGGIPQPAGVGLMGALQIPSGDVGAPTVGGAETGIPTLPLDIPAGFFLRLVTTNVTGGGLIGTAMEIRLMYLELPLNDQGPEL